MQEAVPEETKENDEGEKAEEPPNVDEPVRLTEDVMLDSNHQTMRVYFDPEYLKIESSDGYDQKFLTTTSDMGSYKIQILNLDRQKSKIVTLEIEDKIKRDPGWLHRNNTYKKMKRNLSLNTGQRNPGLSDT